MKCLLMKLGIVSRDIIVCFACNTVDTLVDHRRLRKRFPHIQFIGPVQNTIAKIKKLPMEAKIGVIGTVGTIKSGIYEKHIREADIALLLSLPLCWPYYLKCCIKRVLIRKKCKKHFIELPGK